MTAEKLLYNLIGHTRTVLFHKYNVMKNCFACGLYYQGIVHDLSKFSPIEFWPGVKYYQGNRSPNNAQREACGVSTSWLHHKGRNKHHYEYWIDYAGAESAGMRGFKMPKKYIVEMFCDRVAASKAYNRENYKDSDSLEYYLKGRGSYMIEEKTDELLYKLLVMLAEKGEEYTFLYIRRNVLHKFF